MYDSAHYLLLFSPAVLVSEFSRSESVDYSMGRKGAF